MLEHPFVRLSNSSRVSRSALNSFTSSAFPSLPFPMEPLAAVAALESNYTEGQESVSNLTVSEGTSPFSSQFDSIQWSQQAVATGPLFIGDNNKNFGNITLPYWYNITFLLNISRDVPDDLGVVLFGYVLPFLLVLTLATNLVIVIVLSQSHMRTPTNLVLLAMAIADLLTLLSPAPWYFYLYTLGNYQETLYPPRTCYLYHCMYEVLPALFHTYSIWLTLLLAGQRYVYVCHFSLARTWCTVPRVIRAMLIILLIAIAHQSTRFFDRVFLSVRFIHNNKVMEGCEYLTATWVEAYIGEDVYYTFYYGFRIIFVNIGPCSCLVLLNVLLFRALRRTQQTRERLFAPAHDSWYSKASLPYNNSLAMANNNGKNNNTITTTVATTNGNCSSELNNRKILFEMNSVGNANNKGSHNCSGIESDATQSTEVTVSTNLALNSGNASRPGGGSSYPSPPVASQTVANSTGSTSVSKRDSNSTTIMLIVIVSVFLLLEIPLTLTTILHVLQNTFPILWVDYNTLNTTILITNFFIILSYPINFAIYCGMSRQFRQTFAELFIYGVLGASRKSGGILVTGERTNAITGASSSTFGVTSKSCTFSVTVPDSAEAGGVRSLLASHNNNNHNNNSRANAHVEKYENGENRHRIRRGSKDFDSNDEDEKTKVLETEL